MIGWIILSILLLFIILSFVLRLGVLAGYGREGVFVKIRIGPGYLKVFPLKKEPEKTEKKKQKKERRKEKKQKKKEKKPQKPKKKVDPGGMLSMVWDMLPAVNEALSKFRRKLQIDKLDLHLTWAADDPADAAIRYGQAWAAVETLLAFLENGFSIKERQVTIDLDFYLEKPLLYLQAGFSLTLAQLTGIGVIAGVKCLKVFLAHRKTLFKPLEPAVAGIQDTAKGELNHGKESSHQ